MRRQPLALVLVLFLIFNATVQAQGDDEGRDFLEIALSAGFSIPNGDLKNWTDSLGAKSGIETGIDIGAFVSSNMVLGFNFTYSQYSIDTDGPAKDLNHRFFNPSIYLKYYLFGDGNLSPFFKVHAGIDNPKFATFVQDQNANPPGKFRELSYGMVFAFGGSAGLFYYTSDYSGLHLEAGYHIGQSSNVAGDFQNVDYNFNAKTGILSVKAGVTVFFGTSE